MSKRAKSLVYLAKNCGQPLNPVARGARDVIRPSDLLGTQPQPVEPALKAQPVPEPVRIYPPSEIEDQKRIRVTEWAEAAASDSVLQDYCQSPRNKRKPFRIDESVTVTSQMIHEDESVTTKSQRLSVTPASVVPANAPAANESSRGTQFWEKSTEKIFQRCDGKSETLNINSTQLRPGGGGAQSTANPITVPFSEDIHPAYQTSDSTRAEPIGLDVTIPPRTDLVPSTQSHTSSSQTRSKEIACSEFILANQDNGSNYSHFSANNLPLTPKKRMLLRQRTPETWKDNVAKRKRQAGEEYINKKGHTSPAKLMGEGCKPNCRFKCSNRLTSEERLAIYASYRKKVTDDQLRWAYVAQHVQKQPKRESTGGEDVPSRRDFSYVYSFTVKGKQFKVCKTMFLSTLRMSNSVVATAFEKIGPDGTVSPSKQGKHSKRGIAIDLSVENSVRGRSTKFSTKESNYAHKDCINENGRNVAKMHLEYEKLIEEKIRIENGINLRDSDELEIPVEAVLPSSDDDASHEDSKRRTGGIHPQ